MLFRPPGEFCSSQRPRRAVFVESRSRGSQGRPQRQSGEAHQTGASGEALPARRSRTTASPQVAPASPRQPGACRRAAAPTEPRPGISVPGSPALLDQHRVLSGGDTVGAAGAPGRALLEKTATLYFFGVTRSYPVRRGAVKQGRTSSASS